jgi:hypothetical protein
MTAIALTPHSRRNASNNQQQQQELTTRTLAREAQTTGTSQMSTVEGRPATAEMPEIVEMPTIVRT